MIINRMWAMPNKWTFTIKPIKALLKKYIPKGGADWIDPFAGKYSPAQFTNDLDPDSPAEYNMEALAFVEMMAKEGHRFNGCLFDPPYSLTQVSRSYKSLGLHFYNKHNKTGSFPMVKDILAKSLYTGSRIIYFGWNTNAFGKGRGFEIEEILIVAHGGNRNDTLVTVERKIV